MIKKCIKIPFNEEITGKPGASVRFIEQHTVPLDTTVRDACDGLFVIGQQQLVKNNFLGLFKSMADGVRRDGKPRKIADFLRVYPVFTGAVDLDRGFDPAENSVYLDAELLKEMKLDISGWSLEDATEGRKPIAIESVKGAEIGVVSAAHDTQINGRGLAGTHRVELRLEDGEAQSVDPAHVTGDVSRMDIARAALAALNRPENDGKRLTIIVRGNFANASRTVTLRCSATVATSPDGQSTVKALNGKASLAELGVVPSSPGEFKLVGEGLERYVGQSGRLAWDGSASGGTVISEIVRSYGVEGGIETSIGSAELDLPIGETTCELVIGEGEAKLSMKPIVVKREA